MSTIKANQWLNPDGTENYKCRAWVSFNAGNGTPIIRSSGNVASITDNGVGDYSLNFTSPMTNTNYSFVSMGCNNGDTPTASARGLVVNARSSNSIRVVSVIGNGAALDFNDLNAAVFL